MTILEIKQTAFSKWLLSQSRSEARQHIWECLNTGPKDNLAWDLWESVHGEDRTDNLSVAIDEMLDALKAA